MLIQITETGQTIIAGMGELHLEIIVDRLLREFKVEANVGAPQVAYKETFTKPVDAGTANMQNSPVDVDSTDTVKLNSSRWMQTVKRHSSLNPQLLVVLFRKSTSRQLEKVLKKQLRLVSLAGFPVVGVTCYMFTTDLTMKSIPLRWHSILPVLCAFKEAMQKASPVLLEPIMKVEVTMPEEYMGDVIGDINSRRGRIEGMDDIGGGKIVRGYVPLAEMFGYSTDLTFQNTGTW